MISLIKTTRFTLVSPFGLNTKGELVEVKTIEEGFNVLLHVHLEDGREGLLLCAHYCKWPEELLDHADFIEGCFTPLPYRNDPRLLLGYHPGSITSYKEVTPGVVEISTTLNHTLPENTTQFFQRVVPEWELPTCKAFRRFVRIAQSFLREAIDHNLSEDEAFAALEQRWAEWQEGSDTRLHLPPFLFSYLLGALDLEGVLIPNGALSVELPEYGEFCEVNGNTVRVIRSNPQLGFYEPSPYNPVMQIENGLTRVIENRMIYGFAKAINLFSGPNEVQPMLLDEGHSEVLYKGFSERLPFHIMKDGTLIVQEDHINFGWWQAESI